MESVDCSFQDLAPHKAHRIKRPAVWVVAQPINWHDAWVFQSAGDLGFEQEPQARLLFAGLAFVDLLERHLAM